VEAIFEIGISHASPAVIMEQMVFPTNTAPDVTDGYGRPLDLSSDQYVNAIANQVTSERVKSHLQKYRKNKKKNKEEFLREYDRWTEKALQSIGGLSAAARTNLVNSPIAVLDMINTNDRKGNTPTTTFSGLHQHMGGDPSKLLIGGELPAYLTFTVMLEEAHKQYLQTGQNFVGDDAHYQHQRQRQSQPSQRRRRLNENSSDESSTIMSQVNALVGDAMLTTAGTSTTALTQQFQSMPSAEEYTQRLSGTKIVLPTLTEEESQSSLGVSISHVIGLFYSMSHALIKERKRAQEHATSTSATAPPAPALESVTGSQTDFGRSSNKPPNESANDDYDDNKASTSERQQSNRTPTRGTTSKRAPSTTYDLSESPKTRKKVSATTRKAPPREKATSSQGRSNDDDRNIDSVAANNNHTMNNNNSIDFYGPLAASLNRNMNAPTNAIGRLYSIQQQQQQQLQGMPPTASLYHPYSLPSGFQPPSHFYPNSMPPQQQQLLLVQQQQQQHLTNSTPEIMTTGGIGMMGRYAYHPPHPQSNLDYLQHQQQRNWEQLQNNINHRNENNNDK
jgi:hypothetical protein